MQRFGISARKWGYALIVAVFAGAACAEGESSPLGPDDDGSGGAGEAAMNEIVTTVPLNATSADTLVYFSFKERRLVSRSSEWDLALRRYEIRLNSPAVAGASNRDVRGYSVGNNASATDAQLLAFSAASQLSAFDALRSEQIPSENEFASDRLVENSTGYLNFSSVPVANPSAYWKVKLSNGSYALFRVTQISFTQDVKVSSVILESRIQSGSSLGRARSLTILADDDFFEISLTDNVVVTPDGCNWDLRFNPNSESLAITVNDACGAATYPGSSSTPFASATRADDAPQYSPYLTQLVGPIPFAITDAGAPFRYNLTGNNRLHPSFNSYLIAAAGRVYKMQVLDYYNNVGASGYLTLRYSRIR